MKRMISALLGFAFLATISTAVFAAASDCCPKGDCCKTGSCCRRAR